jgi:opacity protein-like surface antigen
MRKRLMFTFVLLLAPVMAQAQIHQVSSSASDGNSTVQFDLGYFALKGLESRVDDDVLLNDLQCPPGSGACQPLLFDIKDFNGLHVGGEYLFGFGLFEAGVGLGYTQRTVPSIYADLTHSDGTEIEQDLKLRTIPVTFTARFLPLGRGATVEPYIGAGVAAIRWKYSEVGEFVDAVDGSIFSNRYVDDGVAVGPLIVFGLRAPVSNWTVGGDFRWQKAEAKGLAEAGFLGDRLDLGGWTSSFTLGVRF